LDQFVAIQQMAINNQIPNVHDTKPIFDRQGETAICHFQEVWLRHLMDKETEDKTICGEKLHGKLGTVICLTFIGCVMTITMTMHI
jgi:hypothetical protein